ncbi:DUF3108 domain-containing protein [Acinetobacter qingfengensis]|uniref:Uncharacterized protein n=1 Tax=Acinetobacter qingfengensis TaxID=1262585 RepID=A0A1E7RA19_9GAMM|nr:DUF3108 domain-containing protein [Acinetobacter qingfengensis]KAA8733335.1 DUF3108 domain-containing protein [Acinetobacter qingfengensis]OEY96142.1 hypothetical protein BJI46_12545 [Acinetobacter qingfengensis]
MKNLSAVVRGVALSTITAAGLGFAVSSHALSPFQATYQFSYNNKNMGDATRQLSRNGNVWTYQFNAKIPLIGNASEVSKFSIGNGRIQSISYNRQTKILVHSDTVSLNFKPQQKQIVTSRKGQQRVLTWKPGVLDDLNAELQVREDLQNGGIKSSYPIASYKAVENRQFVRLGAEKVKAADGKTYDTVKIRLKHSSDKRNTYFWIAPSLDYLPVKVTHQDEKTSYSLLLKTHG